MINFLLLYSSFSVLIHASDSEQDQVFSTCYGQNFLDLPLSFNFTATHSKSLPLVVVLQTTPVSSVIPTAVVAAANNVGHAASVASIALLSVSNIPQGDRTGTISAILTCDYGSGFVLQPLDWSQSPTQISLGNSTLQYVDGAVLGNWLLFGGIALVHTVAAMRFGTAALRYPGLMVLIDLFLSTPTAQAATTMLRLGNTVERVFGWISLLTQLGTIAGLSRFLWTDFGAEVKVIEEESASSLLAEISKPFHSLFNLPLSEEKIMEKKWLSLDSKPEYVDHYKFLFRDYRQRWYGFMVPELAMTMATGVLGSFQDQSDCKTVLYISTAVYGIYATSIVFLHPHLERFDRIYYGSVASAQFIALFIGSIQQGVPALQNNTALQGISEGIPVALQYVTLARTVYDLAVQTHALYRHCHHTKEEKTDSLAKIIQPLKEDDQEMTDHTLILATPIVNGGHDIVPDILIKNVQLDLKGTDHASAVESSTTETACSTNHEHDTALNTEDFEAPLHKGYKFHRDSVFLRQGVNPLEDLQQHHDPITQPGAIADEEI